MVKNEAKQGPGDRKFTDRFRGPFRVLKFIGPCNVVVVPAFADHNRRREDIVHTDRLKVYNYEGEAFPLLPVGANDTLPDEEVDESRRPNQLDDWVEANLPDKESTHQYNLRPRN